MKKSSDKKKTILLVENEAILAMSEKKLIESAGYEVIHVFEGEEAVRFFRQDPSGADLVLMDINPGEGMTGTEAAEQILSFTDIPIRLTPYTLIQSRAGKYLRLSFKEVAGRGK